MLGWKLNARETLFVPMEKIVPTTGIKKVFKFIFPESSTVGGFNFPEFILFDSLIKLGFFTLIIPFRFTKSRREGRFKMKTNLIQWTISTLLLLGSSIYSFFAVRLLFTMNLQNNPSEAFAVIYGMMRACYPSFWFYTFWIRRNSFNKLLMVCQTASSPSAYLVSCLSSPALANNFHETQRDDDDEADKKFVNWIVALVTKLCVLGAFTKLIVETYFYYQKVTTNDDFIDVVLGFNGGTALYNLYQGEQNLRNLTRDEVFQDWTKGVMTFSALTFGAIHDYIGNMVDAFCFVGAAIMFSICRRFSAQIPKLGEGSTIDCKVLEKDSDESFKFLKVLEKISASYIEIGNVVDAANEIFGPIFLLYVLGAFPSLAGLMVFKQQSHITGERFGWYAMVYAVSMYILVTMTASEASSKMVEYKCWLFDVSLLRKMPTVCRSGFGETQQELPLLSNAVLSRINHLHREVASDSVGLKGCGFFTMTHGVIGTMLGIFVTFAIVIVQFEMDVAQKEKNKS